MKDIVENRRRIPLEKKLSIAAIMLRENGVIWCASFATYYAASTLAQQAFALMDRQRRLYAVPGMNSRALNKAIWESWDWNAGGEEWTPSEPWKKAIIEYVLHGFMPKGGRVLEIGPGAGRWTGELIQRADALMGVDISASCVEVCTEKFGSTGKATFMVGSGHDLSGIETASVDALWSFDVFVHINQAEVERYADEFNRVFKPGAIGIIHHGSVGGARGGWRSNLTHEAMLDLLKKRGFDIVESFKEFTHEGTTHQTGLYEDVITVFRKPMA